MGSGVVYRAWVWVRRSMVSALSIMMPIVVCTRECSLHAAGRCFRMLSVWGWDCGMAAAVEGAGGGLGFLRAGKVVACERVEHRRRC
eukprot:2842801-Alexandrium_andersonii.AAC.1